LSLLLPHDDAPPYVEEGVVSVEDLPVVLNTEAIDVAVLLRLVGLVGVCARGRFR
jgi:hypothetical protein